MEHPRSTFFGDTPSWQLMLGAVVYLGMAVAFWAGGRSTHQTREKAMGYAASVCAFGFAIACCSGSFYYFVKSIY